jgi:alkanesulfonate monooxygenase SsuD/methylene tetrahydromethanopterin reductase-like flavin-dependent oxidoreductase (luciferase family)
MHYVMYYGIHVPNFGAFGDARLLAEMAHEAEDAGWDGFFLWDQIANTFRSPIVRHVVDPWVALTAIALRTRHIRMGTMVTPLPRRRPTKLARETVSLDQLSQGRLILGVGAGGGDPDFAALGETANPKMLASMLDEGLEVLTGLWSGEPFQHEGTHYRIHEAQFLPSPVQSPRIPIWVAATWPRKAPFRRAARWDGVFPFGFYEKLTEMVPPEELSEIVRFIAEQPGYKKPFDVVQLGITSGTDRAYDHDLVAAYIRAGATWWLENIYPERWGSWTDWPVETMRQRIQQGPPRVEGEGR